MVSRAARFRAILISLLWLSPLGLVSAGSVAPAPSWCLQEKFAESKYPQAFKAWQKHFAEDLKRLQKYLEVDPKTDFNALDAAEKDADLIRIFEHSIDPNPGGIQLMRIIAKAFDPQSSVRIFPQGATFILFTLGNREAITTGAFQTSAIGYGGTLLRDDRTAELIYVFPGDVKQTTLAEIKEDPLYQACFPNLHVPPFGVAERMACPTLVFVRSSRGELRLLMLSKELAAMMDRVRVLQSS